MVYKLSEGQVVVEDETGNLLEGFIVTHLLILNNF